MTQARTLGDRAPNVAVKSGCFSLIGMSSCRRRLGMGYCYETMLTHLMDIAMSHFIGLKTKSSWLNWFNTGKHLEVGSENRTQSKLQQLHEQHKPIYHSLSDSLLTDKVTLSVGYISPCEYKYVVNCELFKKERD